MREHESRVRSTPPVEPASAEHPARPDRRAAAVVPGGVLWSGPCATRRTRSASTGRAGSSGGPRPSLADRADRRRAEAPPSQGRRRSREGFCGRSSRRRCPLVDGSPPAPRWRRRTARRRRRPGAHVGPSTPVEVSLCSPGDDVGAVLGGGPVSVARLGLDQSGPRGTARPRQPWRTCRDSPWRAGPGPADAERIPEAVVPLPIVAVGQREHSPSPAIRPTTSRPGPAGARSPSPRDAVLGRCRERVPAHLRRTPNGLGGLTPRDDERGGGFRHRRAMLASPPWLILWRATPLAPTRSRPSSVRAAWAASTRVSAPTGRPWRSRSSSPRWVATRSSSSASGARPRSPSESTIPTWCRSSRPATTRASRGRRRSSSRAGHSRSAWTAGARSTSSRSSHSSSRWPAGWTYCTRTG